MLRKITFACAINLALLFSSASAHYLWINVDTKSGDQGTTNLFFEEGPRPGTGKYLDPFIERGTTWVHTVKKKPMPLKMSVVKKPGKRWLANELEVSAPRSIESFCKWGVYTYGKTEVLLHYYGKYIDAASIKDKNSLSRASQLDLDIVPTFSDKGVEIQVLWKGKPAAGRPFKLRGAGGLNKTLTTDKEGRVRFQPIASGLHSMRTSVDEPERSGTFEGKEHDIARHHSSLTVNLDAKNTK